MSFTAWFLKKLASRYGLSSDAEELAEEYDQSQLLHDAVAKVGKEAGMARSRQAVDEAFIELKRNVDFASGRQTHPSTERGHRFVKKLKLKDGPFVVFSDHHITYSGHIQSFFTGANVGLYSEVLSEYDTAGYTVVENGDVEELVILDPRDNQRHFEKALALADSAEKLRALRREARLRQFRRILSDPHLEPWLEASRKLDAKGRLIRVAGNHDFDLQVPEFETLLKKHLPNQERVFDLLVLESEGGAAPYAIMHGHQFDLASNPTAGAQFGETISETRAVWFQGADRVWRWDVDKISKWLSGEQPLRNLLVTDNAGNIPNEGLPPVPPRLQKHRRDGALFSAFERGIFEHNVAWDHFASDGPVKALLTEVFPGLRFAKFRHMDEELINHHLLTDYEADERPTLVLGHSHEVRSAPYSLNYDRVCQSYANSGSAGRFQNLIWGLEISEQGSRVVSWNRQALTGALERRTWDSVPDDERLRTLTPSEPSSQLP